MVTGKQTSRGAARQSSLLYRVRQHWEYYLMLLPAIGFVVLFKYLPIWGVQIAFQDFNIFAGISGSKWVGLANFQKLLTSRDFANVFRNTIIISFLKIGLLFPLGIVVALLLNEVRHLWYKRTVQTIIYIPHFFSWIVVAGMFMNILSSSTGLVNKLIVSMGGSAISFMTSPQWFRSVLVFSSGWKEVGWNAIVFIAAIAGIDQEMYEAADIDGCGRVRRIFSITLPNILPTIVLMFILRIGNVLEAGTEQILVMYNAVVYSVADVIGTYVYRIGLGQMDYSFSTAVGLFNSIVGFTLVLLGNFLSRKTAGNSIW